MSQKYVEIWEASKSSRNVLNIGICWQLKVYTWIFLIGFGYLGVLNTIKDGSGANREFICVDTSKGRTALLRART